MCDSYVLRLTGQIHEEPHFSTPNHHRLPRSLYYDFFCGLFLGLMVDTVCGDSRTRWAQRGFRGEFHGELNLNTNRLHRRVCISPNRSSGVHSGVARLQKSKKSHAESCISSSFLNVSLIDLEISLVLKCLRVDTLIINHRIFGIPNTN